MIHVSGGVRRDIFRTFSWGCRFRRVGIGGGIFRRQALLEALVISGGHRRGGTGRKQGETEEGNGDLYFHSLDSVAETGHSFVFIITIMAPASASTFFALQKQN